MDSIQVMVGGVIGIVGTIIGTVISHWLALRRDRIAREEDKKDELRRKLVEGVFETTMKHEHSKIPPFARGGSLYFPRGKRLTPSVEVLTQEFRELLEQAEKSSKIPKAADVAVLFLQRLREYLDEKPTPGG